ncbi:integrase [Nostoc sp. C057]|uniref:tyrosine-type recombinase/integrase n=1 Tax=Nostoc sp. C057 TaxID=2576903 RepID=UPI0015C3AB7B|nr:tyrosine-type recombinase/integrase [Nostoc sp. C057]QLE47971.1 integrase [Nostoc sp. C057]
MSELSRVSSDQTLMNMWLHGRPASTTASAYRRNAEYFLNYVGKSLGEIALEDLQAYAIHLNELGIKESSARTKLNVVKSLFTFAAKLNYIRFNVAAALRIPKANNSLAGRILRQTEVLKLINHPSLPVRSRCLLKLMYATGMRVSEACRLKWVDFHERDSGEIQVTVLGKGSKMRTVLVPIAVWMELEQLRATEYVFTNSKSLPIDRMAAHRIIKEAATLAGINPEVSAHWLRHSHATHAIAKGAPLALVRDTLGHSSVSTTNQYLHANPTDSSSNYLGL